jgi:hypothetical protein
MDIDKTQRVAREKRPLLIGSKNQTGNVRLETAGRFAPGRGVLRGEKGIETRHDAGIDLRRRAR